MLGLVGVLCQRMVSGRTGRAGLTVRSHAARELDVELDVVTTRLRAVTVDRVGAPTARPRRAFQETVPVSSQLGPNVGVGGGRKESHAPSQT